MPYQLPLGWGDNWGSEKTHGAPAHKTTIFLLRARQTVQQTSHPPKKPVHETAPAQNVCLAHSVATPMAFDCHACHVATLATITMLGHNIVPCLARILIQ